MKKIGTTEQGSLLVEMTGPEHLAACKFFELLDTIGKPPAEIVQDDEGNIIARITHQVTGEVSSLGDLSEITTSSPVGPYKKFTTELARPQKRGPYKKRKPSATVKRVLDNLDKELRDHSDIAARPAHNEAETKNCARCKKLFLRSELKNGFAYCAPCSSQMAKEYRDKRLKAAIKTAEASGSRRRVVPKPSVKAARLEQIRQADQRIRDREEADRPVQDGRVLPVGMQE